MVTSPSLSITGRPGGAAFMAAVKDHIDTLWTRLVLTATGVAGTSTAISASSNPVAAQLYDGMVISITLPVALAAGATFAYATFGAKPIKRPDGTPIKAYDIAAGATLLKYVAASGVWLWIGQANDIPALNALRSQHTSCATATMIGSNTTPGVIAAAATFGSTAPGIYMLMAICPTKGIISGTVVSYLCTIARTS